jgi:hypothetical protein
MIRICPVCDTAWDIGGLTFCPYCGSDMRTREGVLPIVERPHPLLDAVKAWTPMLPRGKFIGAAGVLDAVERPPEAPPRFAPQRRRPAISVDLGGNY